MNKDILLKIAKEHGTPTFVFNADEFKAQADKIKSALGCIPLCFSIKANPFLLHNMPKSISYVEVCSPGELTICRNMNVKPESILYSGVNKGENDISAAINYSVGILTVESRLHIELINLCAKKAGKNVDVIIRLTSGNQFGADPDEIIDIIKNRNQYENVNIIGLHYYSGTQKKNTSVIKKDIAKFESFIENLEKDYGFKASHIEYGPGMSSDYFVPPYEEKDSETLEEVSALLRDFSKKYPLTVEMGRFLASSCGTYLASVADLKNNLGTNYVICDGGINHLKYYGQTMAMQIPPIEVLTADSDSVKPYTLCGSLCTTADLLVRKVELPELSLGDILAFGRCGAYTITEGTVLFLSRVMPKVILYSEKDGATILRDYYYTDVLNH